MQKRSIIGILTGLLFFSLSIYIQRIAIVFSGIGMLGTQRKDINVWGNDISLVGIFVTTGLLVSFLVGGTHLKQRLITSGVLLIIELILIAFLWTNNL